MLQRIVWILCAAMLSTGGGCGSSPERDTLPERDKSVQDHLDESAQHEREAARHDARVRGEPTGDTHKPMECRDDPLEGVTYSGSEPYSILRPCWTGVTDPDEQHREEARRHRRLAAMHRARASALVAAEARACAGLGEAEISRSPLTRRDDVIRVSPLREHGRLRGATVVLRAVPGLTVSWLRRSLACHRARAAALGYPPQFMADCPMTLPSVVEQVRAVEDGVEVTLRTKREEIAAAVLGRAQRLLRKPR